MEATNLKNAIQIQNSGDFAKLDLTKFSPKQVFNYNCTSCGKYYERKLYRLQQFNFELLCKGCSLKKYRAPWSEEKKKAAQEKRKQTNLERYGVEIPLQSREIQEKFKQTMLERYGVDYPAKSEKIKRKIKQTNLERYGVEAPLQSKEIQEKVKQTNLKKYGVENPWQSEEIQEKRKQTNLERYGVEHALQSKEIQEKRKQTNLERFGADNPRKSEEIKKRIRQTSLSKYGVEYYFQSKEAQSKRKQTYSYNNVDFDSKPELAFYIYCKDHEVEVERCTQEFLYEFEGKVHRYFPDFVVNGELREIKGDQFLNEAVNTWQNPFDHSQDAQFEAKHQCALKNGVKILYSKDYQKCIDYVLEKYGERFFEKYKN